MIRVLEKNPVGLRLTGMGVVAILFLLVVVAAGIMALFGWITVPEGNFVILMRKTGQDLSNDQLMEQDFKGVQPAVLREGYHFYNPYSWWWTKPMPATVIPEMQVGIQTRKFGKPLPLGQVLAETADQKGVVPEVLRPGRYYLNTHAYNVQTVPMVRIEPGFMGVVIYLVGKEPENPNTFVVKPGERGIQPTLLPPGTHPDFSNPWMYKVVPIDVRRQKLELSGETAVDFLSEDGFPVRTEGTIEYSLEQSKLPEIFAIFVDDKDLETSGGLKNIEQKLILPFGRSLYRIYGAQHRAVDYLTGKTYGVVQKQVEDELREQCATEGITIHSFLIRSIVPPTQIRQQYERRELARRQKEQYQSEIVREIGSPLIEGGTPRLAPDGQQVYENGIPVVDGGKAQIDDKGQPILTGGRLSQQLQQQMKDRAEKIGQVRLEVAQVTRAAEQYGKVEMTRANQRLAVAKLELQAANDLAAKKTAAGEAKAAVIRLNNKAQAAGIQTSVDAFGGGEPYARYLLATKMAPAIQSIWSNTDGPFADLFKTLTSAANRPVTDKTVPLAQPVPLTQNPGTSR